MEKTFAQCEPIIVIDNEDMFQNGHVANYTEATPEQRENIFWKIISKLEWHNVSEGGADSYVAKSVLRKLKGVEKIIFEELFLQKYNNLYVHMVRNNIVNKCLATHIVALGKEQYETLLHDSVFIEILLDNNEYLRFDKIIRDINPAMYAAIFADPK